MSFHAHIELNVEHRTAVDWIEPVENHHDDLRDAALRYVEVLNAFARRIESALREGNMRAVASAFWSTAYGLGLSCCEMTMTECARRIGVERATLSKGATDFCRANNLPPSWHMKQEKAALSYCESRLRQVAASNGNGECKYE